MILVTGKIELASLEEVARVKAALMRRAEKSRADEGCLEYVFSVELDNPRQIRLFEMWQSEELLNAHLMVPDDEFNLLLANADIKTARVDMHDVSTSRELMSR